ncbi:agamous-like MADS-box protein AGL80 [Lolium perenne]|jgi:hypothetical protein|uniref:agamous-like MADS-box protein AGL80 n=1 Tax=Lolium perenne TaxID=4522 RepID=UPI0021F665BA|nr:agamous-like MADS-box protein AGL80 [Lolium perenne]
MSHSYRGRLKMQWIMDKTKRKKALDRRLPNVLKKVREISVLCDTPACLVVYLPGEARPVVWPSPEAARKVVRRYRDLDFGRFKEKLDGLEILQQRNEKVRVRLAKVQQQTRNQQVKLVLHDFLAGYRENFNDLPNDFLAATASAVQTKLDIVKARLLQLRSGRAPPRPKPEDGRMVATPRNAGSATSMTLGREPPYGSYLFGTLDASDIVGEGSVLPTAEEMHAWLRRAGILSRPPKLSPSFLDL